MIMDRFRRRSGRVEDVQDIVENLNRVLNTKKGFGYWLPDFGIGDYNVYRGREHIVRTLVAEIRTNVERYEPRVRIDVVEEVESTSPFRIKFQVSGVFVGRDRPFFIVVDSIRHDVRVEGGPAGGGR